MFLDLHGPTCVMHGHALFLVDLTDRVQCELSCSLLHVCSLVCCCLLLLQEEARAKVEEQKKRAEEARAAAAEAARKKQVRQQALQHQEQPASMVL